MKDGYYTIINGFEYKIEQRLNRDEASNNGPSYVFPYQPGAIPKIETVISTEDKAAADDTFFYNEEANIFVKVIDPKLIKEVFRYRVSYLYKGYLVGKFGCRDNNITIFLGHNDKELATELGFAEHDRTEYIKVVDISEVEMKQEGPFHAGFNASGWLS